MWICRYCAAHVKDDVLTCPCCGTSAPARLQPELAEQVTAQTHTTSEPRVPSISLKLGFPPLESQSIKQAVKMGALIGFSLTFVCNVFTSIQGISSRRSLGSFAAEVIIGLFGSFFFGVFGGLIGGLIIFHLFPLVDHLFKLTGRTDPAPVLPPHSALAKTETLNTQTHEQELMSESSKITDLRQPTLSSITDLTSGIQSRNEDLSS